MDFAFINTRFYIFIYLPPVYLDHGRLGTPVPTSSLKIQELSTLHPQA